MSIYNRARPSASSGFTLVELMVGLVLGLLVMAAASAVFVSTRQVYSTTESLGRVQENTRAAFELMARDIREAGGNACNSQLGPSQITNVVNNLSTNDFANFRGGIVGYTGSQGAIPFGTGPRQRVSGTDAIVLKSAIDSGLRILADNSSNVNIGTQQAVPPEFLNAIVMACDPQHAAIFQVTAIDGAPNHGVKIQTSNSVVPGNSSDCVAPGGNCPNGNPKRYAFGCTDGWWSGGGSATPNRPKGCQFDGAPPATIARLRSVTWYVGHGTKSGTSLYRRIDGVNAQPDEIAEFVSSMELQYLLPDTVNPASTSYRTADEITSDNDWARVTAVRLVLKFAGEDKAAGVGGGGLERELATTVAVRNRLK